MTQNSSLKEFIVQAGEGRHLCPVCQGGRSGEKSFKVYRAEEVDSLLLFGTCYRASCDLHGKSIPSIGTSPYVRHEQLPPRPVYWGEPGPLPSDMYPYIGPSIRGMFGLDTEGKLAMRVEVPRTTPTGDYIQSRGQPAGWVIKTLNHEPGTPKVFRKKIQNFIDSEHEGKGAWYGITNFHRPNAHIMVFEDMLSAARMYSADPQSVCIASLGTKIGHPLHSLLRQAREDAVITVIYDTDAIRQGIKAGTSVGGRVFFTNGPDVKDLSGNEFREFLAALEPVKSVE